MPLKVFLYILILGRTTKKYDIATSDTKQTIGMCQNWKLYNK